MPQPVMTQHLRIEVVRFKARMMDMTFGALEEEETMMIDELLAAIQSAEGVEFTAGGIMDQLRGKEVEMRGVEFEGFGEIGDADAEVSELVDRCWGFLEALKCVGWASLLFRLCDCEQMFLSKGRVLT